MKTKLLFTFLFCFYLSFTSSAQINDVEQIGERIHAILEQNYQPDSTAVSHLCRRGCVFAKFSVNDKSEITNLSFSNDSATLVVSALKNAIVSLQKDSLLMQVLKKSGKVFIQPVMYDYWQGCVIPKIKKPVTAQARAEFSLSFYKMKEGMDNYFNGIFNMMNYNDSKKSAVDCILLSPLGVGKLWDSTEQRY